MAGRAQRTSLLTVVLALGCHAPGPRAVPVLAAGPVREPGAPPQLDAGRSAADAQPDAIVAAELEPDAGCEDAVQTTEHFSTACPAHGSGPDRLVLPRNDLICRVVGLRLQYLRKNLSSLVKASEDPSLSNEEHLYASYLRYRLGDPGGLRAFVDAYPVHSDAGHALWKLEEITDVRLRWFGKPENIAAIWVLGCAAAKGTPGAREKLIRVRPSLDAHAAEEAEAWLTWMVEWHPLDMVRAAVCARMPSFKSEPVRFEFLSRLRRARALCSLRSTPFIGDHATVARAYIYGLEHGFVDDKVDGKVDPASFACDDQGSEEGSRLDGVDAPIEDSIVPSCPGLPRFAAARDFGAPKRPAGRRAAANRWRSDGCPGPVSDGDNSPLDVFNSYGSLYVDMMADVARIDGAATPANRLLEENAKRSVCAAFDATGPGPLREAQNHELAGDVPRKSKCNTPGNHSVDIGRVTWSVMQLEDGRLVTARNAHPPASAMAEAGQPSLGLSRVGRFVIARETAKRWICPADPAQECHRSRSDKPELRDEALYCAEYPGACVRAGVRASVYVLDLESGQAHSFGPYESKSDVVVAVGKDGVTVHSDRCVQTTPR
jgi:hypothetical protein